MLVICIQLSLNLKFSIRSFSLEWKIHCFFMCSSSALLSTLLNEKWYRQAPNSISKCLPLLWHQCLKRKHCCIRASNVKLIIELSATVEVTMVCQHFNLNRVREASYTERKWNAVIFLFIRIKRRISRPTGHICWRVWAFL